MTTAADIVLPDAQATPVNHTFAVCSANGMEAIYEDRAGGVPIGFGKLRALIKAPSTKTKTSNRNYQIQVQVAVPVLETLGNNSAGFTPAPTVAYTVRGLVTFDIPERATTQQRKDIIKYLSGALVNAQISTLVSDLNRIN